MLLLLFFVVPAVLSAPCSDGVYCSEILKKRFTYVALSTKCSMWVYGFGPDLFPGEINVPVSQRLMTSKYCPVSCAVSCNNSPAQAPTTKSTSTPPTTTKSQEEIFQEVMDSDTVFKNLLSEFGEFSVEEGMRRYGFYQKNKVLIDNHNRLFLSGLSSYKMGINAFSIRDTSEIASNALDIPTSSVASLTELRKKRETTESLPDSVDWREYMQPIADQKRCGGCWAFAMTAVVEATVAIRGDNISTLSVQQLLDCDHAISKIYNVGNRGCAGGYLTVAVDYLIASGLRSAHSYPFVGSSSSMCSIRPKRPQVRRFDSAFISVNSSVDLIQLDQMMEDRLLKGPVATGFSTSAEVYSYESGIYDGPCGNSINHAVVIVGFTNDSWIIRNSWGSGWGENGYIRIRRQSGEDPCRVLQYWASAAPDPRFPAENYQDPPDYEDEQEEQGEKCDGDECESCGCEDDDDDF